MCCHPPGYFDRSWAPTYSWKAIPVLRVKGGHRMPSETKWHWSLFSQFQFAGSEHLLHNTRYSLSKLVWLLYLFPQIWVIWILRWLPRNADIHIVRTVRGPPSIVVEYSGRPVLKSPPIVTEAFSFFPLSLQANIGIMTQIRPRPLLTTYFSIHHSYYIITLHYYI
jgi:hypothetical protein